MHLALHDILKILGRTGRLEASNISNEKGQKQGVEPPGAHPCRVAAQQHFLGEDGVPLSKGGPEDPCRLLLLT